MKKVLPIILAIIMLLGAVGHVAAPDFYAPMVPDFIPLPLANILSVVCEGGIGILLLLPRYRSWGGLAFMLLMIGFLPLHIWDMLKASPTVGPPPAPQIRLIVQVLLIYAGYWVYRAYRDRG